MDRKLALLFCACLTFVACGDDGLGDGGTPDSSTDGSMDSTTGDGGDTGIGMDGSTDADAAGDGGGGDLTITGTVYGEGASDREPDAGVTPWPDAGMPDGAVATPGGRIVGATVHIKNLDGTIINTTTTDGTGQYTIQGPADTLTFMHVEPVEGYAGSIRAEQTRGADYEAYDFVLPDVMGLDRVASDASITRDTTRGWIACGFNPVDDMAGGDGADLGAGITHDPAFNITDVGVILGNRLVPLCESDGSNPPGALPGATCTMDMRAKQIFFPNVLETMVPVMPLDPASGTCALRFPVTEWLTAPGALTVINIDCTAP